MRSSNDLEKDLNLVLDDFKKRPTHMERDVVITMLNHYQRAWILEHAAKEDTKL